MSESNKPVWGTCPTTPITNDNFQTAINTCLSTNPVDGMCVYSEYGAMPNWDVSNVTDMSNAFEEKTTFNADISAWHVVRVTNMEDMFKGTDSFDQDISSWCVTNFSSEPTGFSAGSLLSESNKPVWGTCPTTPITNDNFQTAINTCLSTNPVDGMCVYSEYGAMPNWDVSNVTDMSNAFEEKTTFNADISAWNVSSVTAMERMFYSADNFNADISAWNVSSVTTMERMFYDAGNFNRDIGSWDVSNVTNMTRMFMFASSFNQDISLWCVTNVSDPHNEFSVSSSLSESNKPVWGTCSNLSIDEQNQLYILIYPNPTANLVYIQAENVTKAEIFDLRGRKIKATNQKQIDLSNISSGSYILQVTTQNNTTESFKIIKK